MRIAVVHPGILTKSAKWLAELLGADRFNTKETYRREFEEYDVVFNYGNSCQLYTKKGAIINKPHAVAGCISKIETFRILHKAGVPHPSYAMNRKDIPKDWYQVVVRKTANGAKNEGMEIVDNDDKIPPAELYTEYFYHKWEYRIVVFKGKVVCRYRKDECPEGGWDFTKMLKKGFEAVDKACIDGAAALGIDYVGFDVVEDEDGKFIILEANSGPVLTEEVGKYLQKYFKQKD